MKLNEKTKEKTILITDADIDYSTAKIWCAFASEDFQKFADDSIKTINDLTKQAKEKFKDDSQQDSKTNDDNTSESDILEESLYQFFINETSKVYSKKRWIF